MVNPLDLIPHSQTIGYIRVSSIDQNVARQLASVDPVDRLFTDEMSGKDTARPQLVALLAYAREGDTVVVHSMDRLARNVDDLRRLVSDLTARGVKVRFITENLTFTGEDSPMSNLLLTMLGAVAQFERDLIRERQRQGIAIAKANGVYNRRKTNLGEKERSDIVARLAAGERKTAIARRYGVDRKTIYRVLEV